MSEQSQDNNKRTWSEEFEVAGRDLVEQIKKWIEEGNVHRLIIRRPTGEVLMEIPVTAGVLVGGAMLLVAPLLATLGALAALVARVTVEVVRSDGPGSQG
jgi:hypothetical protein